MISVRPPLNIQWENFNVDVFGILVVSSIILLMFLAVSWFLFSRISIPAIDMRMEEVGIPKACHVDLFGLRVLMIANAISLPLGNLLNHEHDPFIDAKTVRLYATKSEKRLGLVVTLSAYLFALNCVIGYFFIPES